MRELTAKEQATQVVTAFAGTDKDLLTIVREHPAARDPVLPALLALQELLNGRRAADEALSLAEAVGTEIGDANLAILFFGSWAEASCSLGRLSEAAAVLHHAQTLISEATPPEVRGYLLTVEGFLASCEGDKLRREQILREVLDFLPHASPRRQFHVLELAYLLARMGRLSEVDTELDWLNAQASLPFIRASVGLLRFIDAVEIGSMPAAETLLSAVASDARSLDAHSIETYRNYQVILDLMRTDDMPQPPELRATPKRLDAMPFAAVSRCLLAGAVDHALAWARLEAKENERFVSRHGFSSFDLIRAELSARHGLAARRILETRRTRGNRHYLDDLFLARVELLAGNSEIAARHFGKALEAAERYRAEGRLDFELRLATELAPYELVRLSRGAAAHPAPRRAALKDSTILEAPRVRGGVDRLIGHSSALAGIRETILRYAPLAVPVFVTGETGTGKELVARALHESGPRSTRPFIAINCGAIAETLLESELFGHERGAFSGAVKARRGVFEEAADGTLLLDEIGDISNRLQLALLRVLETDEIRPVGSSRARKVCCRVIFATNADLEQKAADGRFRKDLLFRLRRLEIHIPPLRERAEDIVPLAEHFLELDRPPAEHATMSQALQNALRTREWPGNVRELRNVVERMRLVNADKLAYDESDLTVGTAESGRPAHAGAVRPAQEAAPSQKSGAARLGHAGQTPERGPPANGATGGATRRTTRTTRVASVLRGSRSRLRRLQRLRELFAEHTALTRSEIVRILGVSPNTATHDLQTLCEEGLVERIEPSASSRSFYFQLKTTNPDPVHAKSPARDKRRPWFPFGRQG